jgi:hypothetical protein
VLTRCRCKITITTHGCSTLSWQGLLRRIPGRCQVLKEQESGRHATQRQAISRRLNKVFQIGLRIVLNACRRLPARTPAGGVIEGATVGVVKNIMTAARAAAPLATRQ